MHWAHERCLSCAIERLLDRTLDVDRARMGQGPRWILDFDRIAEQDDIPSKGNDGLRMASGLRCLMALLS